MGNEEYNFRVYVHGATINFDISKIEVCSYVSSVASHAQIIFIRLSTKYETMCGVIEYAF